MFTSFVFFGNLNSVLGNGSSLLSSYVLELGQSLFLGKLYCRNKNFEKIYDEKILRIDDFGVLTALKEGNTKVAFQNKISNTKTTINISVIPKKNIRFFLVDNEEYDVISRLNVYVTTPCDTNITKIKLLLDKVNKNEFITDKKFEDSGVFVWNVYLDNLPENEYRMKIFVLKDDLWVESGIYGLRAVKNSDRFFAPKDISAGGVRFIMGHEGFSSRIYFDIVDVATIGYGKVIYPGEVFYNEIPRIEAFILLKDHVNKFVSRKINDFLMKNNIICTQNQFDALVSFSYNVGTNWINSDVKIINTILDTKKINTDFKKVNVETFLNVREKASTDSNVILKLHNNEIVRVVDIFENWTKIEKDGIIGFCSNKFLVPLYNLGNINIEEFSKWFLSYHHAGNKCVLGLLMRRTKELDIFYKCKY
ncbi:MAG: SH3 domain-containing protein [Candidatus Improbicoccus pseudotrichonymphae]|uniref:Lysozyme n=1 Tax=Candidatus Improbicoccus pseudotrichonymphae TaxID=3033792 RepID=A0AA48IGP6_9FIRM|nr:MAG: SH3 domain-containing protein [Candidatus Improbicoccus pseudotrichonymphae]